MLLGATKIGDGESTRTGAGRNTYISFCFFTFCSHAHEEGMEREKQTASWKAFTYLIFPLRRFNRRWTLLLEVLFAVENLLVSVRRRWSVRPTFCSDSRISPFRPSLLSPSLLPCLFVSFYFFHIFFCPFSLEAVRQTTATNRALLKLHFYIRELLNFVGTGEARRPCPSKLIFHPFPNGCPSRNAPTSLNYLAVSFLDWFILMYAWKIVRYMWRLMEYRGINTSEKN